MRDREQTPAAAPAVSRAMSERDREEAMAWAAEAATKDSGVSAEAGVAYLLGEGPDPFPPPSERSVRFCGLWLQILNGA